MRHDYLPDVYFLTYTHLENEDGEKKYYVLHDGRGNIYPKQVFLNLLEKVKVSMN